MNEYEQMPEPDDVLLILAEVNEKILPEMQAVRSTPPEYLTAVRQHNPDLPVLDGYFDSGRFAPIARDMQTRFDEVNRIAWVMSSESLRAIVQTIDTDKGTAVDRLAALYRQKYGQIVTIGFSDSANDAPLLAPGRLLRATRHVKRLTPAKYPSPPPLLLVVTFCTGISAFCHYRVPHDLTILVIVHLCKKCPHTPVWFSRRTLIWQKK